MWHVLKRQGTVPAEMEHIEMNSFSRRRGCFESGNCWAILGETHRSHGGGGMRAVACLLVVAVALLTLPAALLLDDKTSRMPSLAERSTRDSAVRAQVNKIVNNEIQGGARGRNVRPDDSKTGAVTGRDPPARGLFSEKGLEKSTAKKEKLLLNLLRSLEQPCDDVCVKSSGKDEDTLHFCRAACRKGKTEKMKHLIDKLNRMKPNNEKASSASTKDVSSEHARTAAERAKLARDSKVIGGGCGCGVSVSASGNSSSISGSRNSGGQKRGESCCAL